MIHRLLVVSISLGFLVAASAAGADKETDTDKAKKLVGTYDITGKYPDGPIEATATIEHMKGDVVIVTYQYKNAKTVWIGLGKIVEKGTKLRITYETVYAEDARERWIFDLKSTGLVYDKGGYKETWKKQ